MMVDYKSLIDEFEPEDISQISQTDFVPLTFSGEIDKKNAVVVATIQVVDEPEVPHVNDRFDEGYEKGFQEGLVAGKGEQDATREEEQKRFGEFFAKFQGQLQVALGTIEKQAIELSLSIAEKIVYGLTTENREYLQRALDLYLKEITERELVVVKVSPSDYEILQGYMPASHHIKLVATEDIASGVVVETRTIKLKGDLSSMIESVRLAIDTVIN